MEVVLAIEKRKVLLLERPLDERKETHLVGLLVTSLDAKRAKVLDDKS